MSQAKVLAVTQKVRKRRVRKPDKSNSLKKMNMFLKNLLERLRKKKQRKKARVVHSQLKNFSKH